MKALDLGGYAARLKSPLVLAYIAFSIFGICLIANCQVASDGTWYLYGKLLARGVKLYADLKLPQQPLFILVTAGWSQLLGNSWVLSLFPTVLNLILFTHGYYLLARRSDWSEPQKAVVFLTGALAAIAWNSYRFDDYRVLTDVINLYAVICLLHLQQASVDPRLRWQWPLLLGVLCGLSFMTRANDGLMLFIAVALVLMYRPPGQRLPAIMLLTAGFLATAAVVLFLTGDTAESYFKYTLLHSSESKGGASQVALSPFFLVADLFRYLSLPIVIAYEAAFLMAAAVPLLVERRVRAAESAHPRAFKWMARAGVVTFDCALVILFNRQSFDCVANVVLPIFMLSLMLVASWAFLGLFRRAWIAESPIPLFLIPGGALVASGMSSGGKIFGQHGPIGLFIVILPLAFTLHRPFRWGRAYVISIECLVTAAITIGKIGHPLMWENYKAQPMFVDRAVTIHPLYGPMIVDRRLNRRFERVCRIIHTSRQPPELLSLPYSYANYYCGIDPWRMNVQTFFDTSSSETIGAIVQGLQTRPPAWILYQRQLGVLLENEVFFNHGRALPHRALDELIQRKVEKGDWKIVSRWSDQPEDDWELIATTAPSAD